MTNTQNPETYEVAAELAPVGVLMWPVRSPEYADNYTLQSVAVVRTMYGIHVEWTYRNGKTRKFEVGQEVICAKW